MTLQQLRYAIAVAADNGVDGEISQERMKRREKIIYFSAESFRGSKGT